MSDSRSPSTQQPHRKTRILFEISEIGNKPPRGQWSRFGFLGVALTLLGVALTLLIHYGVI